LNAPSANATQKNAGLGPGVLSANEHKHDANCGTHEATDKAFKRLQQAFADHGHRLTRTVDCDGTVRLFAGFGLYSRELQDLEAARRFLVQIGGRE
jgi:hypothetical protein